MGKGDNKLGGGALYGREGGRNGWWCNGKGDTPCEISGGGTVAFKEEIGMKVYLDSAGGECSSTTSVAELADGNEGGVSEGRKQMGSTSRDGKEREV
jgi:hypothetical protein